MKIIFFTFLCLTICSKIYCHQIDTDCFEPDPKLKNKPKDQYLPFVNVKIVRVTDLPFPLTTEITSEEETVHIPFGGYHIATFNGGKNHTQEFNPRELFLFYDGYGVYGAMGNYSRVNDSGIVKDDFGCIRWYLEVAGFESKTTSQTYGQELKWINIGTPIPIVTRDLVRLEILDPGQLYGPEYDNECAFFSQFVRNTNSPKEQEETSEADVFTLRQGQVMLDIHSQVVYNKIVKSYSVKNETGNQVFELEIASVEQIPEEMKVQRNLSLTFSEDGVLTAAIAFADFLKVTKWTCNIQKATTSQLYDNKLYFSQYEGVSIDGEYARVLDYVEFYDPKASSGNELKGLSVFVLLIIFSAKNLVCALTKF